MTPFRPLFWPTVTAVPLVLLCFALGVWQIRRLAWKEGLIAERHAAMTSRPVPVPRSAAAARGMQFHRVVVTGEFLNDKEIHLAATSSDGDSGFHVLTPLREQSGRIVFVNRGFVPQRLKDPRTRLEGEPAGTVRVIGLLRVAPKAKPNWFVPDNRPAENYWFWLDLKAMVRADKLADAVPFYIDADATPNPGGWPRGGLTRLELPNHHLQYAITWFSLAVAMIVIYFVYHLRIPGSA
ncbi:MAG TPA: SURF1 family protein [Stellaceae bacterium]|nr:SURF1 family protein [Stellaceae bacterium]